MRTTPLLPFALSARRRSRTVAVALLVSSALFSACGGNNESPASDSAVASTSRSDATGSLTAPHGGMLVAVGNGVAQLEFNVDTTRGVVLVHVLDAAAKEPLRLTQGRIDLTMLDLVEGPGDVTTVLAGEANPKTNETVENTSVFVGYVPQLVERPRFRARVQRIEIGGQVYTDIPVSYPPDARA